MWWEISSCPSRVSFLGQRVTCQGGSAEQAQLVDEAWVRARKATGYDEYYEAMEIVLSEPIIEALPWVEMEDEGNWSPRPSDSLAFRTGTEVFEDSTIPVLAFFGELDRNVDPIRSARPGCPAQLHDTSGKRVACHGPVSTMKRTVGSSNSGPDVSSKSL